MARSTSFSSNSRKTRHHNPLSDDIALAGPLRAKPSKRKAKSEEDEDKYVDSRSSRKILKIGQELVDEEEREANLNIPNPAFAFDSRFGVESETDEDAADQEEEAWRDEDDEAVEEIVCEVKASAGYRTRP